MKRLIILGAGGHGKVILDIARLTSKWDKIEFLDDRFPKLDSELDAPVIGKASDAVELIHSDDDWFVAIGDAAKRLKIISSLNQNLSSPVTLTHPASVVSPYAKLESGSVVMAGAIVNPATHIGAGSIINSSSSVDHDCTLAEGVHVCPGAHLGGNVMVGKNTWIGLGSAIKHGINIGENVMVGAGSTVIYDLPDNVTVAGNPAKKIN